MKEFVQEACGFVVPYLDIEAMADAIVTLIRSPALRSDHGRRAAEKVRAQHDVSIAAPKILDIIERLL